MSCISWNCRGIGPPRTKNHLRRMIRKFRPSIVFLMETKNNEETMEDLRVQNNFQGKFYVHPEGTAGGLALWWTAGFSLQVLDCGRNFIDVFINYGCGFFMTFTHAPSIANERRVFSDSLSRNRSEPNVHWIVIGDLNAMLFDYEKLGGGASRRESVEPFKRFIFYNGLMDMGYKGPQFTWNNKRRGDRNIKGRLDRGFCSPSWREFFEEAVIFHESDIGSDHQALRHEFHSPGPWNRTPFRFDERWASKEECDHIVMSAWASEGSHEQRVRRCQNDLKEWAKGMIQAQFHREEEIKRRLESLSHVFRSDEVLGEERILIEELDFLWRDQERMWKQRSTIQWLAEGDRNTKFFYNSTVYRKHSNWIVGLKGPNGEWIKRPMLLSTHIKDFFKELFTAKDTGFDNGILQQFPRLVTDDMNFALSKTVTREEIKKVVFALGPHKSPGPDGFNGFFFRKYWDLIGDELTKEVETFFSTASLQVGWNDTHISLIPKIPSPEKISQFRPIS
ncbi:unnamed protein product [Linum trigynum]|uniref:Endonuclease/exonuclease/phosphatase domain-containing protein n=1 Tax=Linum trigynum TaxID=586398 RepID=A0AAV2E8Z1_9ROSI